MLSTKYRLRLESICKDIASGTEVSLEDMIWSNKLAKANTSARGMLVKQEISNRSRWIMFKIFGLRKSNSNKKGLMVQMT